MEQRKACANCDFFQEHDTKNLDSDGHCTNKRLNERLCFETDFCNLWATNEKIGRKKYLQNLLNDISLNLKDLSDVLHEIIPE